MENKNKLAVDCNSAAFAVLTHITGANESKTPEQKKITTLLRDLSSGELKVLAGRGVICIDVDCERLINEIATVHRICERDQNIEKLIELGAPYEMMKIFGVSERKFRFVRKALNIQCKNQNRPQSPTEDEVLLVDKYVEELINPERGRETALLSIHTKTGISLSKIWQVLRDYPECERKRDMAIV